MNVLCLWMNLVLSYCKALTLPTAPQLHPGRQKGAHSLVNGISLRTPPTVLSPFLIHLLPSRIRTRMSAAGLSCSPVPFLEEILATGNWRVRVPTNPSAGPRPLQLL
jgi:hypothetical protein